MKKHTKLMKPAPLTLRREQIRILATDDLLEVGGGMTAVSQRGKPCPIPPSTGPLC